MRPNHWLLVGMFFGGLALQLQGVHGWHETLTPSFVAGILVNAGTVLRALFAENPRREPGGGLAPDAPSH